MFNAIKYTKELETAGFTRDQAEASVKVLMEVMDEKFATKTDLEALRLATQSDLKALELGVSSRINELELKMNSKFQEFEFRVTTRLGSLMTVLIGIAIAILRIR